MGRESSRLAERRIIEMIYPLPRLRVLCVDDNRDAADSTGILLEHYGCDVTVCYDAETALAIALQFKPDLCLIDLSMPGTGGCELAMCLRAWGCESPLHLIAVTAYGSEEARRATVAAGFDRHLVKPVDWEKLVQILVDIERSLGRAGYISCRLAELSEEGLVNTHH
jgi:two-component system OmpR family response regulator